jgi:hypothetical protein
MTWAEDMGIDCGDESCLDDPYEELWEKLKMNGYLWSDRYGNYYREEDIDDGYLSNILDFCKRNRRPEEQVKALKELARKRGLKGE